MTKKAVTMMNKRNAMPQRAVARAVCIFLLVWFTIRLSAQETRVEELETQKFLRKSFRDAVSKISAKDFTEVEKFEDIVNAAYFDSRHWLRVIFGNEKDPHNEAVRARHSYYIWPGGQPGFDMLRHSYTLGTRAVLVTESAGIIHVGVRLSENDSARLVEPAKRAANIANDLFQLPAKIQFTSDPSEGFLVSNSEHLQRPLEDWKERIYAIAGDPVVEFLIHKEDPLLRPHTRNYSVWFDVDFRKHPPLPRPR